MTDIIQERKPGEIEHNLDNILSKIDISAKKANRDPKDITLIAVSKFKPVSDIQIAYNYGIRDFGENRVQELLSKIPQLPEDINWHLIGHLQTNKVKSIVGKVKYIHSIDSLNLAEIIDRESAKAGVITEGLLEINVAEEDSKFGFTCDISDEILSRLSTFKNLKIRGLMTVAPVTEDPEKNRTVFRKLKQLSVDIDSKNLYNVSMDFLSMGMTGDYTVAIEEDADFVRVGTGIFGSR